MRRLPRIITSLTLAWAGCALLASPALAGESCHAINAKGVGQDTITGPDTLVSSADIIGGGLLQGTEDATFTFSVAFPFVSFSGTVTFTTNRGTLTAVVKGNVNLLTGAFSASGPVVGGTGKLAGAIGNLAFEGVEDLVTGEFTDDITGEVCVDLAP